MFLFASTAPPRPVQDARMLIRGELLDVPITVGEEGSARLAKRPRAPIYTGDLGR